MLLFKSMTREIYHDEILRLLETEVNTNKYQVENKKPLKFQDHHLFSLLDGNPQAIIIVAPILLDSERCLDLVDLYHLLT